MPSIYNALVLWMKTASITKSDESTAAIHVLKNALTLIDERWKLAGKYIIPNSGKSPLILLGIYLKILEIREVSAFV